LALAFVPAWQNKRRFNCSMANVTALFFPCYAMDFLYGSGINSRVFMLAQT
jgi:hypothetical protein